MNYNIFQNHQISALGFRDHGTFSADSPRGTLSFAEMEALYDCALRNGVNFFEVSRDYGRANPEPAAGRILGKYPRDDYYLCSGYPGYDLKSFEKPDEIFFSQLENLQTSYFDFYYLQYVTEFNIEKLQDASVGLMEFLIGQKKAGRIRFLGASFFGNIYAMRKFLDQYGEQIDFCMFALNWMDWDFHAAKQKLKLCRDRNLPVLAADPLKNGVLEYLPGGVAQGGLSISSVAPQKAGAQGGLSISFVAPQKAGAQGGLSISSVAPQKAGSSESFPARPIRHHGMGSPNELLKAGFERLQELRPQAGLAEWSYRYLQALPEVAVTMLETGTLLQLQTAIDAHEEHKPTNAEEEQILYELAKSLIPRRVVNCIGCRRCMQHCIKNMDIAGFMDVYNEELVSGPRPETSMYVKTYPVERQPQSCCHWGPCQSICPQKLDIIRMMLPLAIKVKRSPYVEA